MSAPPQADSFVHRTQLNRGRFMSMADVVAETTLSQATINRMHRRHEFPPKRRLSAGRVGWWEADIAAWKASRELVDTR